MELNHELSDELFLKFSQKAHFLTGIFLAPEKKVMLGGRIRRRLRTLEMESFQKYFDYLLCHKEEEEYFIDLVTTNETYFYRTPRVWEFFNDTFLSAFVKENPGKTLLIWSGASSSGEEAHTIGIFCQEFKSKNPLFNYKIIGTDISNEILEKAQAGLYNGRAIERFRKEFPLLFKKYMVGDDEKGYQVIPEIKANIQFKQHNLFLNSFSNHQFDLVFLRNVLIYFNKEDQEKVLKNVSNNMTPNAFLIVGESETLTRLESPFSSYSPLVYYIKANEKENAA